MRRISLDVVPAAPSRGEAAREALLKAALVQFADQGLHGASLREIARTSHQNIAAISYYFGGKKGLYEALLKGIGKDLHQRSAKIIRQYKQQSAHRELDPDSAMRLLLELLDKTFCNAHMRRELVFINRLLACEDGDSVVMFKTFFRAGFREVYETLTQLLVVTTSSSASDLKSIVRVLIIVGQALSFVIVQAIACRGLNVRTANKALEKMISEVVRENLKMLCIGLRDQKVKL